MHTITMYLFCGWRSLYNSGWLDWITTLLLLNAVDPFKFRTFSQADANAPGEAKKRKLSEANDEVLIEIPVIKEVSCYYIYHNNE